MGKILERTVRYNGKEIAYQLEFKSIKNINLHVYADGIVFLHHWELAKNILMI